MCKVIKVQGSRKRRAKAAYTATPDGGAFVPDPTASKARLHMDTGTRQAYLSVARTEVPPTPTRCLIPEAQTRWGNKYVH